MKTITHLVALVILGMLPGTNFAQKFKYSVPGLDTLERSFVVGGGAANVLRSGQTEVLVNSSLTSYWIAFHEDGAASPILDRVRNTIFITDLTAYYGFSYSGRYDLGLQVRYARNRLHDVAASSPLDVFKKGVGDDKGYRGLPRLDTTVAGIPQIGIRFRAAPFARIPELIVSGGYLVSILKDDNFKRLQLQSIRDIADLGVTYYKAISNNVFYFFGTQVQMHLSNKSATVFFPPGATSTFYTSSSNLFLIHRTRNQKLTFYPGLSYSLSFRPSQFDNQPNLIKSSQFLIAYGGAQYSFDSRTSILATLGLPLITDVTSPQQEIVRESFSVFQIGFRMVM